MTLLNFLVFIKFICLKWVPVHLVFKSNVFLFLNKKFIQKILEHIYHTQNFLESMILELYSIISCSRIMNNFLFLLTPDKIFQFRLKLIKRKILSKSATITNNNFKEMWIELYINWTADKQIYWTTLMTYCSNVASNSSRALIC